MHFYFNNHPLLPIIINKVFYICGYFLTCMDKINQSHLSCVMIHWFVGSKQQMIDHVIIK